MPRYQPQYFANHEAEHCHTVEEHKDQMRENGETTRTLYRARPLPTTHFFWCKQHQECGESGPNNGCGTSCSDYEPRNGKSGRCRHHANCYEPDLKEVLTITLDSVSIPVH